MFDQTPNVPPIKDAVNVGCGWTANIWNLQPQVIVQ